MSTEGDTRRLFVTDIPLDAKLSECLRAFEQFGGIQKFTFCPKEGPHTGRAFLEFKDAESGTSCLQHARRPKALVSDKLIVGDGIEIKGTPVVVLVQREKEELLEKKRVKDKRNLDLAYEGQITAEDEAAIGVSQEELSKRKRLFERNLEKLSDVNNKVSRTRLAVFNLPSTSGTGQIRKIFAVAPNKYRRTHKQDDISKVIKKSPVRITEVRKVAGQDDVAFVEFTLHEHALGALREVNNNPKYFGDRRLIVQFAIENNFATLKRRKKDNDRKKMRTKRFANKEPPLRGEENDEDSE